MIGYSVKVYSCMGCPWEPESSNRHPLLWQRDLFMILYWLVFNYILLTKCNTYHSRSTRKSVVLLETVCLSLMHAGVSLKHINPPNDITKWLPWPSFQWWAPLYELHVYTCIHALAELATLAETPEKEERDQGGGMCKCHCALLNCMLHYMHSTEDNYSFLFSNNGRRN